MGNIPQDEGCRVGPDQKLRGPPPFRPILESDMPPAPRARMASHPRNPLASFTTAAKKPDKLQHLNLSVLYVPPRRRLRCGLKRRTQGREKKPRGWIAHLTISWTL